SLVKGLMPLRFGFAGTLTALIFSRPGRVKEPAPFLLIEPATAPSSEASTARTSRAATPLFSDRCATRPDLLSASLIGLAGPDLAADLAGAAFFEAAFLFFIDLVSQCLSWVVGFASYLEFPLGPRNVGKSKAGNKGISHIFF